MVVGSTFHAADMRMKLMMSLNMVNTVLPEHIKIILKVEVQNAKVLFWGIGCRQEHQNL